MSRKVTKTLSRKQIASLPNVQAEVQKYRDEVKNLAKDFQPMQIYNTDQSGFNIELLSGRTLTTKGEKIVYSSINQSNSETHSYTIQPIISMDGSLIKKLLIVLQEPKGDFGPNVKKHLFRHDEIHTTVNSSGKVSKAILKEWFKLVYFPSVSNKSLLILDSFPTYRSREQIDEEKPRNKTYSVSTIPPGLTGYCQPLDVSFFRQYKAFHRRISDHINFHWPDVKLHTRNTILKLQACTIFLFRSPRFDTFRKYAWFKAGLCDSFDRSIRFDDPKQYCFDENNILTENCSAFDCQNKCFIRCSWCGKFLCFRHLFLMPLHTNDGEFNEFHYCCNYWRDWFEFFSHICTSSSFCSYFLC